MRRPLVRILVALGIVAGLGGARQALAQSAYGYSGLEFGGASQSLYSYSMTDLDYVAQAYYGVLTDAYLYAGNNIVASSEGATNGGYVYLYYSTSINTSYWIQTNHWIYPIAGGAGMPNFSCVTPEWYAGSFGVSACGTGSAGTTYIGTSYASGDTYGSGPSISSMDETTYGTAQTGTSGYLIIYGSNLTNLDFGSTSISLGDSITTSLTYIGQNQLNVYYMIPGGATPGGQTLTVTTPYGYATATFQVYPISITTPSLSGGIEGFPFQQQLWASGGQPPYTWSMAPGSSLPAGLTLTAANGFLGGTPTAPGNAFSFTVQVTDSLGRAATQAYTIAIQGFTLGTVAPGVTGVAGGYTVTVPIPITWTLDFNYAAFQAAGGHLFGDCGSGGPEVSLSYSFGGLYAVFNTGLYSGSFPCSVGLAIGALEIIIHIPLNVTPQARIFQNSQDITGQVQTVIVGQKIALQAVTLGGTIGGNLSNPAWVIGGNYVGGWQPSAAGGPGVQTVNTNAQDVTFYFTTSGVVTVTFGFNDTNGVLYTATTGFTVLAPGFVGAPPISTAAGSQGIFADTNNASGTGVLALHYDGGTRGAGMQFSDALNPTIPVGYGGVFEWIQVVSSVAINATDASGKPNSANSYSCVGGVDSGPAGTQYVYTNNASASDSPYVPLLPGTIAYNVSESFQMFLMFQPALANAIYVPVAVVPWNWSAGAISTDSGNSWIITSSDASPTGASNGSALGVGPPSYGYPNWSGACTGH